MAQVWGQWVGSVLLVGRLGSKGAIRWPDLLKLPPADELTQMVQVLIPSHSAVHKAPLLGSSTGYTRASHRHAALCMRSHQGYVRALRVTDTTKVSNISKRCRLWLHLASHSWCKCPHS